VLVIETLVRRAGCADEAFSPHQPDAQGIPFTPNDLALALGCAGHERNGELTSNVRAYLGRYFRAILRNIFDPAFAFDCLTIELDPRELMSTPTN
jgi:hypothetical protein